MQKNKILNKLKSHKIPRSLIPGLTTAVLLGWSAVGLFKTSDFYKLKTLFPKTGFVSKIEDGDTFVLKTGQTVRLLAIDAPRQILRQLII